MFRKTKGEPMPKKVIVVCRKSQGNSFLGLQRCTIDRLPVPSDQNHNRTLPCGVETTQKGDPKPKKREVDKKVFMFHDNAHLQAAHQAQDLHERFGWNGFRCPPYSPNLAIWLTNCGSIPILLLIFAIYSQTRQKTPRAEL